MTEQNEVLETQSVAPEVKDEYLLYSKRHQVIIKENGSKLEIDGILIKTESIIAEGNTNEDKIKNYATQQSRNKYNLYLKESLLAENLIILTGAGSSIAIGDASGMSMKGLWDESHGQIGEDFKKFCKLVNYPVPEDFDKVDKNLESLLTYAELFSNYNQNIALGTSESDIRKEADIKFVKDTIGILKVIIIDKCSFAGEIPAFDKSTHENFLKNISYRKNRLNRPKIFTTNYDRAFEVAATSSAFITIDGFSFDSKRIFNGKFFDFDIVLTRNNRVPTENNFAPNVIHLYKLHGSIDWFQNENSITKTDNPEQGKLPLMIFPNRDKFQLSYDQPYFEMMSRFQNELRKSGSTTLIIIGYSFGDNHINRVIEEALRHNAYLKIIVVDICLNIKNDNMASAYIYLLAKATQTEQVLFIKEAFKDFVTFMPSTKDRTVEIFGDVSNDRQPQEQN